MPIVGWSDFACRLGTTSIRTRSGTPGPLRRQVERLIGRAQGDLEPESEEVGVGLAVDRQPGRRPEAGLIGRRARRDQDAEPGEVVADAGPVGDGEQDDPEDQVHHHAGREDHPSPGRGRDLLLEGAGVVEYLPSCESSTLPR